MKPYTYYVNLLPYPDSEMVLPAGESLHEALEKYNAYGQALLDELRDDLAAKYGVKKHPKLDEAFWFAFTAAYEDSSLFTHEEKFKGVEETFEFLATLMTCQTEELN